MRNRTLTCPAPAWQQQVGVRQQAGVRAIFELANELDVDLLMCDGRTQAAAESLPRRCLAVYLAAGPLPVLALSRSPP